MKTAIVETIKTLGRPVKRAYQRMTDSALVIRKMPKGLAGDILLTFDDGPHPVLTPQILDLLDKYDAKAIFFVIGDLAEQHPELLADCHARGHLVANHTFTHLNDCFGGTYDQARILDDMSRCQALVEREIDLKTTIFRPPRGEINRKTLTACKALGHSIMWWSIEGGEWGKRSDWSAQDISNFVCENTQKRDIMLLHDDNEKSVLVLADLLEKLSKQGFDLHSAVQSLLTKEPQT